MAAARNSVKKRESKKRKETPPGTWLGGARPCRLWLCYLRSLPGKQKSGISGSRRNAGFLEKEQLGRLVEGHKHEEKRAGMSYLVRC